MSLLTRDDVISMREALNALHDEVGRFLERNGNRPAPGSKLAAEMTPFRPDEVMCAYLHGSLLIQVVADQLTALTKTITEPVQTIAPWTCLRALLESAALSAWLLEPDIGGKVRVQRSLAHRYEGMKQQAAFIRAAKQSDPAEAEQRINDLEKEAFSLGFTRVVNAKGRRDGIGQRMPTATELIEQMLNGGDIYRLLSAFAHGHHWAYATLGFQVVEDPSLNPGADSDIVTVRKHVETDYFGWLVVRAATSFAKPVWFRTALLGWEQQRLVDILEHAFDALRVKNPAERIWRSDLSTQATRPAVF